MAVRLTKDRQMLDAIANAQRDFLATLDTKSVFGKLLEHLLSITESEYGFIGETKFDENGNLYLQTHAITNIAWNAATRAFFEANKESGLKFTNLKSLFGHALVHEEVVLTNDPESHPSAAGIPRGHPPLKCFLGIPFFGPGHVLAGMVGIANKPKGYTEDDVSFLRPFILTCSNLINARAAHDELEEKVALRTAELRKVNEVVVSRSAAQLTQFACLSHELRTPLNGIVAITSLLQEDSSLSSELEQNIKTIGSCAKLLEALVSDILDYSKLEGGNQKVEIRHTALQSIIQGVVNTVSGLASERNIKILTRYDHYMPPTIDTDPVRLQQILYNLLGNAIKFSSEGSEIELIVRITHEGECPSKCTEGRGCSAKCFVTEYEESESEDKIEERTTLHFSVKDYGRGIEASKLEYIFDTFTQSLHADSLIGTGLGLSIVNKLVQLLDGDISVKSELGKGAEFTVKLPGPLRSEILDSFPSSSLQIGAIVVCKSACVQLAGVCSELDYFGIENVQCQDLGDITDDFLRDAFKQFEEVTTFVCIVEQRVFSVEKWSALSSRGIFNYITVDTGVNETASPFSSPHDSIGITISNPDHIVPCMWLKYLNDAAVTVATPRSLRRTSITSPSCPPPRTRKKSLVETPDEDVRILVAEDNKINERILRKILQKLHIQHIEVAINGKLAVYQSLINDYDLILLDMNMPVMGGIEACDIISERRGKDLLPKIFFLTASAKERSLLESAEKAGADGWIGKPFKIDTIRELLNYTKEAMREHKALAESNPHLRVVRSTEDVRLRRQDSLLAIMGEDEDEDEDGALLSSSSPMVKTKKAIEKMKARRKLSKAENKLVLCSMFSKNSV